MPQDAQVREEWEVAVVAPMQAEDTLKYRIHGVAVPHALQGRSDMAVDEQPAAGTRGEASPDKLLDGTQEAYSLGVAGPDNLHERSDMASGALPAACTCCFRCFAAAYGLASAPMSQVQLQLTQRRNSIGIPVLGDQEIDVFRKDQELAASKAVACEIAETLQAQGYIDSEARTHLLKGYVLEQLHVQEIAEAMQFSLLVYCHLQNKRRRMMHRCA